jgi:hypothetical protein
VATIQFHQAVRNRVQELIDAEVERIISGYPDYSVYREQIGYLKGLRAVLTIAEEIEKGMT